jgi:uncharacterized tellurite resistance protein B-like protein
MLRTLQDLFDSLLGPAQLSVAEAAQQLRLATAVLLVEVMRADSRSRAVERQTVLAALRREFVLGDDEASQLLALAEHSAREATDYHGYTSVLNERLSEAEKLRVIEAMWQVAYADGQLEAYENHVLWRIADLLHLPHGAYIAAKMRARDAAGVAPEE